MITSGFKFWSVADKKPVDVSTVDPKHFDVGMGIERRLVGFFENLLLF